MEEPTAAVPQMHAPMHLDDDDTANVGVQQALREARSTAAGSGRRRQVDAFDEPTRAVDWGTMDDLARGSPPGGRMRPEAPPEPQRRSAAQPVQRRPGADLTRRPDEDTRSVDLNRAASLSEIDWDLD